MMKQTWMNKDPVWKLDDYENQTWMNEVKFGSQKIEDHVYQEMEPFI